MHTPTLSCVNLFVLTLLHTSYAIITTRPDLTTRRDASVCDSIDGMGSVISLGDGGDGDQQGPVLLPDPFVLDEHTGGITKLRFVPTRELFLSASLDGAWNN